MTAGGRAPAPRRRRREMTQEPTIADRKAQARKAALQARGAVDPGAGEAVRARLRPILDGLSPGTCVSAWLAIGDELDLGPTLEELSARGITVALPCTGGSGQPLVFRSWRPGDPLVEERFGTRAPRPDAPPVDPDVVLVPLLSFDRQGYRLGYGGGFYDRTLASLRARGPVRAIGVAYAAQEVDAVPRHDGDERLDAVVTEREVIEIEP